MKITVLAAGSRGDVQPYLALAVGLKRAGSDVTFAANLDYAPMAAPFGLDFHPIGVNAYEYSKSPQVQAWLTSKTALDLVRTTGPAVRPVLEPIFRDTLAACQESDLIVYHSFTLPFVYFYAHRLNLPYVPASLYPLPTRAHAALPAQVPRGPGGLVNLLSHHVVDYVAWRVFGPPFRRFWRARGWTARGNPHRRIRAEAARILCAYSPAVLPRPADFPASAVVTGYWFLPPDPAWQPDPDLAGFIEAGDPPVYVGFGSMGSPEAAQEMTSIVLNALSRTGLRGVLGSGWGEMGLGRDLPDTVRLVRDVPFEWLFPRMAAVIHHGGAGTTALALQAGVPNVVVPHFSDNFFWGRRVADLGAGPAPLPRDGLTEAGLVAALTTAVSDAGIRVKAQSLGRAISTEKGVERAVEEIEAGQLTTPRHGGS